MKLFLDFLPLIVFFAAFKLAGSDKAAAAAWATTHFGFAVSGGVFGPEEAPMLLATLAVMAATAVQIVVMKLMDKPIGYPLWISLALVTVMGGATLWFHNEMFIKWKPTLLYAVLAAVLWGADRLLGRNLLQKAMGAELDLPAPQWRTLNTAWALFFAFLAVLNVVVFTLFDTDIWATFKVFGVTGLLLVFSVAQVIWVSRHLPDAPEAPKTPDFKDTP